jgi:T5orf172 domain
MADELSDDELLDALGVSVETKPHRSRTPREERIVAGFEDIQKFTEMHGRPPSYGEGRDIFERLYAVRLDRLREQEDCRALLAESDTLGLLGGSGSIQASKEDLDDESLLAELGVAAPSGIDLTTLNHVKPRAEIRAAEEIASRTPCQGFEQFKPLFLQIRRDLENRSRKTRRFQTDAEINAGEFFILGGQLAYVADVGKEFRTEQDRRNARLRVIFDNGTESNGLLRSFQRALYKDSTGRRITEPDAGPLFGSDQDDDDAESGTIYVLRSKSDHPYVAAHRELVHKIGVTIGDVKTRIAQAEKDATYLLADVEIIASYKLFNINRVKLESLLHRIFLSARLDIEIEDRFGRPVAPREWYLVPLAVIDEVVSKIKDNSIAEFAYNPATVSLERIHSGR